MDYCTSTKSSTKDKDPFRRNLWTYNLDIYHSDFNKTLSPSFSQFNAGINVHAVPQRIYDMKISTAQTDQFVMRAKHFSHNRAL